MTYRRRDLLALLSVTFAGAAAWGRADGLLPKQGPRSTPVEFPPFELQASADALRHLTAGIARWRVERMGNSVSNVWIRGADGSVWLIGVDQRGLRHMFEVFALGMLSMAELRERWENWVPLVLPDGVPAGLRELMTTRPPVPTPPADLDPWPFESWRTEVLRRAEFIVEGADAGPTFGDSPNIQSAARPGVVPSEAAAFCEVAAGVLFTGDQGRRALMAVDWMPMDMLVTEDAARIEAYLADCETMSMESYLRQSTAPR